MSAVLIRGEKSTHDYPKHIDAILRLPEPHQTYAVIDFLGNEDEYGMSDDDKVLVKTSDGRPMTLVFRRKRYNISPQGRRLPKSLALELIRLYGRNGRYYMRDITTGINKREFDAADPEKRRKMGFIEGSDLKFNTSFLTHDISGVVEDVDDEEE